MVDGLTGQLTISKEATGQRGDEAQKSEASKQRSIKAAKRRSNNTNYEATYSPNNINPATKCEGRIRMFLIVFFLFPFQFPTFSFKR